MNSRMPLDAWHRRRDHLLTESPELERLDCMNPFQALAQWRPEPGSLAPIAWESAWIRRLRLDLPGLHTCRTRGIRSALRRLLAMPQVRPSTVWMPADVFPTYITIAEEIPIRFGTYATWPELRLPSVAGSGDWLVIPLPASPTGRMPDASLVQQLMDWAALDRWIFLDAVYHYLEPETLQPLLPLLRSGRAILATSFSKSFLLRCKGGLTWVPDAFRNMEEDVPLPEDDAILATALTAYADLPERQQAAYRACWNRLTPRLRRLAPDWLPPVSGYLSTIPCPPEELLRHGFLAIPPEVFGQMKPGWSIITCLHQLEGCAP